MGVTIHFEGKLKSEEAFLSVMDNAKNFAQNLDSDYKEISEYKTLERVRNEKEWNYTGLVKGVEINLDPNCDPLILEFDENLYIQEFCKTQYAVISTHINIVSIFKEIEPFFEQLNVVDEGEYWETKDRDLLKKHIDNCFIAIEKAKAENPKLAGPFRLRNQRIVDLMEIDDKAKHN